MRLPLALAMALAVVTVLPVAARAEWRPPELRATKASLPDVLVAYAKATGVTEPALAQRRERWTYTNGSRTFAVRVAVRGADFRVNVMLGNAEYADGRSAGVRWRADANGITHATLSDDQGDAVDRVPESVFPLDLAACSLAGESDRFGAAWVVVERRPRDKPHWFYVDETSGLIAHEITREGKRTVVTAFERFETAGGLRRPHHWHVTDGDRSNDLDVAVDDVAAQAISDLDVAIPQTRRVFTPASPLPGGVVSLPATFRGRTIYVDVTVDGSARRFILDSGTASITIARRIGDNVPSGIVLEHATIPTMRVGPLALDDVSTLAILGGVAGLDGILGYDFFLGHVVHVDYADGRVEVMTPEAAEAVFRDPRNTVIPGYFDEGIPLIAAVFGAAQGDRFALDTGSPRLFVLAPFAQRYQPEIDRLWSPWVFGPATTTRRTEVQTYLEGSIVVEARKVSRFRFGPAAFADTTVGVEIANTRPDAIDIPLDGIIGTDEMRYFDWWFDYDGGRIALRRNPP